VGVGPTIQHLSQEFCKNVAEKNGIVNILLQRKLFQREKAKRPNEFSGPTNSMQGQEKGKMPKINVASQQT